jgi:DDE superfamily endonuclease
VFVDECGTHTSMVRRYARAPKGERAYGSVPRNRGKNTTLVASLSLEGIGEAMAFEEATTKAVLRDLRRATLGSFPETGASRGDGQPWGPQGG